MIGYFSGRKYRFQLNQGNFTQKNVIFIDLSNLKVIKMFGTFLLISRFSLERLYGRSGGSIERLGPRKRGQIE